MPPGLAASARVASRASTAAPRAERAPGRCVGLLYVCFAGTDHEPPTRDHRPPQRDPDFDTATITGSVDSDSLRQRDPVRQCDRTRLAVRLRHRADCAK